MHLSRTKKILLVVVLVSLVVVVVYGFLVRLVFKQQADATTLAEELAYEVDREIRLRSLDRLLGDVEAGRETINTQFLSGSEDIVAEYITTLESLSQYTPIFLEISSVITEGEPGDPEASLQVVLSVSGSESAVANFVDIVESLPTMTSADEVGVSIAEDGTWDASFTLRALVSG